MTLINPVCERNHEFVIGKVDWSAIMDSQREPWRHKCAACAYEQGYRDAIRAATGNLFDMTEADIEQLGLQ